MYRWSNLNQRWFFRLSRRRPEVALVPGGLVTAASQGWLQLWRYAAPGARGQDHALEPRGGKGRGASA